MPKPKLRGPLTAVIMITGFALVMKYQDTATFQSTLRFLFNPDARFAPPAFWQEYRMLIAGALVAALIAWYRPTWKRFRDLILIYRDSPATTGRPSLFPRQASYLLRQDKTLGLTSWLVEMAGRGALQIKYRKGSFPWHLGRGTGRDVSIADQELLDALFQGDDEVTLQPVLREPHPRVRPVADRLFRELAAENGHHFQARQSPLPAWVLFSALLAELPFFMAGLGPQASPMTLPATLFSAVFMALPAYVLAHELPTLFSDTRVLGYIKLGAAALFTILGHWVLYGNSHGPAFLTTALGPGLVLATGVLVFNAPRLTSNPSVIQGIVGYRKHLGGPGRLTREDDLPWTLGLGVHADLSAGNFQYGEPRTPAWLETDGTDGARLLKLLHQTLATNVSKAVHGEMKRDRRTRGRRERSP